MLILAALIVFFAYFYTAIQFDPVRTADNLRKQGGFIPGIRPGPPTADYLNAILVRITLPGSLFLAAIALIPTIVLACWNIDAVPVRRHVDPDRRGRRARDDEADRVAADDAPLRGLPELAERDAPDALRLPGIAGGREGHPGPVLVRAPRDPADLDRRHPARGRAGGHAARASRRASTWTAASTCPTSVMVRMVDERLHEPDAHQGVHPRRVPAHRAAGPGARGGAARGGHARSTRSCSS